VEGSDAGGLYFVSAAPETALHRSDPPSLAGDIKKIWIWQRDWYFTGTGWRRYNKHSRVVEKSKKQKIS